MRIFEFWTQDPTAGRKRPAPEGRVAALQADWAVPMIADKLHSGLPETDDHSFQLWLKDDELEEVMEYQVVGRHVVTWDANRIMPKPEPVVEPEGVDPE